MPYRYSITRAPGIAPSADKVMCSRCGCLVIPGGHNHYKDNTDDISVTDKLGLDVNPRKPEKKSW